MKHVFRLARATDAGGCSLLPQFYPAESRGGPDAPGKGELPPEPGQ